ncbi:hypothetical protein SLS60_005119 [Paraconiothyrium brasiliense]|uniref:DUF7730 domain-containing protein n=1 Tax=Paraconiothyrium brasiliense TaxID=300254 RepID=A0ABR3RGG5_9PLEO
MSKRSRKVVNYAESDNSDEEFDAGGDVEVKQPHRKRRKVTPAVPASTSAAPASPPAVPAPTRATSKSVAVTGKKRKATKVAKGKVAKEKKKDETSLGFLQLPGEIRNMIYEYAFTSDQQMYIVNRWDPIARAVDPYSEPHRHRTKAVLRSKKKRNDIPYNLLRTCKQVCREATPFLYTNNLFSFSSQASLHAFIVYFPEAIPHLRNIEVPMHLDVRGDKASDCQFNLDHLTTVPLERLLATRIQASARTVEEATMDFYNVARNWIKAVGRRRSDKFAALEVLQVRWVLLPPNGVIHHERTPQFFEVLRDLIERDQEDEKSDEKGHEKSNN